jgi:biopolymer transport protein ExbD
LLTSLNNGRHKPPKLMAELNMTPFVDICLVILIIFMITAPFAISGVDVQVPKVKAQALSVSQESIVLTITQKGDYFLGKTALPKKELVARIKKALKEKTQTVLFIRGDSGVPYGRVMEAMAAAQQAGAQRIGMIGEGKPNG